MSELDYSVNVNDGGINAILIKGDGDAMNWVESKTPFGTFYGKSKLINRETVGEEIKEIFEYLGMTVYVSRRMDDGKLINEYVFTNDSGAPLELGELNAGIAVPFNDNYESAAVCERKRCHQHIWTAGNTAYIAAKRMDGSLNNVGLGVNDGAVKGYAVERAWNSNDRGDTFFLIDTPKSLNVGESFTFSFVVFAYSDFEDFYAKMSRYENYIDIRADKYSVKIGEKVNVEFRYCKDTVITTDFGEVEIKDGVGRQEITLNNYGDNRISVEYSGKTTYFEIYAHEGNLKEIDKRIDFIIDKQQVTDKGRMHGAFMLYDNEAEAQYLENKPMNDRGPARERMGMVISMIERVMYGKDLSAERERKLIDAIKSHIKFIDDNIVKNGGKVCEAPKYKTKWYFHRLYNYSWAMLLYVAAYELFKEKRLLIKACSVARTYYKRGGNKFYAINLPFKRIVDACSNAGLDELKEEMKKLFLAHGDNVVAIGTDWPAHEVKYEQSIVAPSVDILLECYKISNDEKYLNEAKRQMPLLEAFNGVQPSFHFNEIAIRHWDGFWFGKRKMYGDTFPHYWSCITAGVYAKFAEITGDESYAIRADMCLNNNLCLIQGGRGACAYVMPDIINGNHGKFYDPLANDQDWLMWFNLRYNSQFKGNALR